LLLNLIVFFSFMVFFRVDFSSTILLLPFYLTQLFLLVLGLSFFLSILNVKFRDINHIWSFILLLGFFITPIVYPLSIVPFDLLRYYLLNPLARMIVDMRDIIIYSYIPNPKNFIITLAVSLLIFFAGFYIFYLRKKHLVEEL
jgi:ABC-type polysaccharide/polyol phosphate export permease